MITSWTSSAATVRISLVEFVRIYSTFRSAESSGGAFQIRPHKDFLPVKGRDRLLSLKLLSELPNDTINNGPMSETESLSEPRNAYDFMRRRREFGGDPTLQKWNASVRLANYASVENCPLCVRRCPVSRISDLLIETIARLRRRVVGPSYPGARGG